MDIHECHRYTKQREFSLHRGNSGSAWTQNKFQLTIATMPSLHFGNSVPIAFCLLRFSPHWFVQVVAPLWPIIMGLTVVATANQFVLDTVVGVIVIATELGDVGSGAA